MFMKYQSKIYDTSAVISHLKTYIEVGEEGGDTAALLVDSLDGPGTVGSERSDWMAST